MFLPRSRTLSDLHHAREAVGSCLSGCGTPRNVEAILKEANLAKSKLKDPEAAEGQIAYFEKNIERMRYAAFRKNGFFIGSGVVEGACKHVVGKRLKQSGMFWSLPGAGFVLDYRCAVLSNRYDSFWVGAFGIAA